MQVIIIPVGLTLDGREELGPMEIKIDADATVLTLKEKISEAARS